MAEIFVSWILALIVLAIGWGVVDRIAIPLRAFAQSLQTPERSKCFEIVIGSLLPLAVISIMVAATDGIREMPVLPPLLIWAGGVWLIPVGFDAIGHNGLFVLAIIVVLVLFWVESTSHPSIGTHAQTDVSTQQRHDTTQKGYDTSASLTGLGFLFWIVLIGLTMAAIARYTSTWNAGALNS